jgi:hypothetical protein
MLVELERVQRTLKLGKPIQVLIPATPELADATNVRIEIYYRPARDAGNPTLVATIDGVLSTLRASPPSYTPPIPGFYTILLTGSGTVDGAIVRVNYRQKCPVQVTCC